MSRRPRLVPTLVAQALFHPRTAELRWGSLTDEPAMADVENVS